MSATVMLCGKCNHAMHWKECDTFTATAWTDGACRCRNDVATMSPYDPDPLYSDDFIAGLYIPADERPSTPLTFAWIVLAGLLCIAGGLALVLFLAFGEQAR